MPLFIRIPEHAAARRTELVGLEDVFPTLLQLANIRAVGSVEGTDLLASPVVKEPVSMFGDPLALSIRTDLWRFSWQSGMSPFPLRSTGIEGSIALYDAAVCEKRGWAASVLSKHEVVANMYRDRLKTYLQSD